MCYLFLILASCNNESFHARYVGLVNSFHFEPYLIYSYLCWLLGIYQQSFQVTLNIIYIQQCKHRYTFYLRMFWLPMACTWCQVKGRHISFSYQLLLVSESYLLYQQNYLLFQNFRDAVQKTSMTHLSRVPVSFGASASACVLYPLNENGWDVVADTRYCDVSIYIPTEYRPLILNNNM